MYSKNPNRVMCDEKIVSSKVFLLDLGKRRDIRTRTDTKASNKTLTFANVKLAVGVEHAKALSLTTFAKGPGWLIDRSKIIK